MITFATSNAGKFARFQRILANHDLSCRQGEHDLFEPQEPHLETIARLKATQAYGICGGIVVVEDSGLCIPALNGWPGAFTKPTVKLVGLDGFLTLTAGLQDRRCHFERVLAFTDINGHIDTITSTHEAGTLTHKPVGDGPIWSPLSYIFQPTGHRTTMADMTVDETATLDAEWQKDDIYDRYARLMKRDSARFGL